MKRLQISELRKRLNASTSTISRWVKAGRLAPPHFLGGRRLWFEDQVAAFEASASSTRPAKKTEHDLSEVLRRLDDIAARLARLERARRRSS